jgi:DNA-binding response OmpR family regulator
MLRYCREMNKSVRQLYPKRERMGSPAGFEGSRQSHALRDERPEAMRIWLLGSFRVSVGSRYVESDAWRLKKAANLVKLLSLEPGHRMHREQVIDLLWPESGRKSATNNLRQVLCAARRVLVPAAGSLFLNFCLVTFVVTLGRRSCSNAPTPPPYSLKLVET